MTLKDCEIKMSGVLQNKLWNHGILKASKKGQHSRVSEQQQLQHKICVLGGLKIEDI